MKIQRLTAKEFNMMTSLLTKFTDSVSKTYLHSYEVDELSSELQRAQKAVIQAQA